MSSILEKPAGQCQDLSATKKACIRRPWKTLPTV